MTPDIFTIYKLSVSSRDTKIGCPINPTARSEKARLHSRIIEGRERRDCEAMMDTKTKLLPRIAANISGTFIKQLMMMMVEVEVSELSLNVDSFIFKLEINSRMKAITEVLKMNLAADFSYVAYRLNFDCNLSRYFMYEVAIDFVILCILLIF